MLTFPVVRFSSLHLITKVDLCCSECFPLNWDPDRFFKLWKWCPKFSGWPSCGPIECRAGAVWRILLSSGWEFDSPFSFLKLFKVGNGSPCYPNRNHISSKALPLTIGQWRWPRWGSGHGLLVLSPQLASDQCFLERALWQGQSEATALLGRVYPSSWFGALYCLTWPRVNSRAHISPSPELCQVAQPSYLDLLSVASGRGCLVSPPFLTQP